MAGLAVLERQAAVLARELRLLAPPPAYRTAVEMATELGIALDPWQRAVLTTEARYVLMLASRQAGISPGERQSKLLLRKVRRFYGVLRSVAPPIGEGQLTLELRNGSEVWALPGKEETVRGFSDVDLLLEDEAAIVDDALYQAARPMVAVSGGRIVLMSTARGSRGHFHHEYDAGGSEWHRAVVTAYDVPRIDRGWLERERARIGDWWWEQEYMCVFKDAEDQLFATDLVTAAVTTAVPPLFGGE